MANTQIPWREFQADTRMLTIGAAVAGAGGLIWAAGTALFLVSVARAGRDWVGRWDVPPSEMANRRLRQAQLAAQAGRDAWRAQGA
ncbi:hypothetical protein [Phaeacidiphilus oryzae]|jgi:hypothetical protein|uniref:hypothetical protein n=1 Tax=Phaeacidiphilus oryzae TaxID=348818 RepID=UPI000568C485|nr:hypothetical protein [Phaeacidiphilus oryzae]